jgi:tartrate dehydratase beta subunit/fumarate hydratase class I family protein
VIDHEESPYILEGAHRFDALRHLKIKKFPALVVVDTEMVKIAKYLKNK